MGEDVVQPDELDIARRAIEKGYISPEQLRDLIRETGASTDHGAAVAEAPSLPTILVERGLLSQDQLQGILGELSAAARSPAETEQTFGRYMLINRISESDETTLWKAWQKDLRRWVLLQVRKPCPPEERAKFLEAAQRAATLEHPNVARVYEAAIHNEAAFVASEHLKGRPLDKAGPFDGRRATTILMDVEKALTFAHDHGVFHGALTPASIVLADAGESGVEPRTVVMDFGFATRWVTPYTAPELVVGDHAVSVASDTYALGAVAYFVYTGRPPYEAPSADLPDTIRRQPPPTARQTSPSVPLAVDHAINRAMAREPGARIASARDFVTALNAPTRVARNPTRRRAAELAPPPRGITPGMMMLAAFGAILIVILVITAVAAALKSSRPPESPPSGAPAVPGK